MSLYYSLPSMPVELKEIITTTAATTTCMQVIYNYIPEIMFLGYIVLQLFCIYNLYYMYYYYYYYHHHHHHHYYYYHHLYHHHHQSFMELGHLLTRSGLMHPEVSLNGLP